MCICIAVCTYICVDYMSLYMQLHVYRDLCMCMKINVHVYPDKCAYNAFVYSDYAQCCEVTVELCI